MCLTVPTTVHFSVLNIATLAVTDKLQWNVSLLNTHLSNRRFSIDLILGSYRPGRIAIVATLEHSEGWIHQEKQNEEIAGVDKRVL